MIEREREITATLKKILLPNFAAAIHENNRDLVEMDHFYLVDCGSTAVGVEVP